MLQRGKVINRPVITKLWVDGRACEDRSEWVEEVRAHCERCCDDKEETSEVQAEGILGQRRRGDHCVPLQERRATITVDKVLRARGKMLPNKANGPADCLVSEMLQCLPTETVYEVAHWFDKLFRGECRARRRGKLYASCSSKKLTPSLRIAFAGFVRSHN